MMLYSGEIVWAWQPQSIYYCTQNHNHYVWAFLWVCVHVRTRDAFLQAFIEGTGTDLQ